MNYSNFGNRQNRRKVTFTISKADLTARAKKAMAEILLQKKAQQLLQKAKEVANLAKPPAQDFKVL